MRNTRLLVVVERHGGLVSGVSFGFGCLLFGLAMLGLVFFAMLFVVGAGA